MTFSSPLSSVLMNSNTTAATTLHFMSPALGVANDVGGCAAGNPHRNPLRNARKKVTAIEGLARTVEDGGSLDGAQRKKLESLRPLRKELANIEKRHRAYEKKAKQEFSRTMKQDRNRLSAYLLSEMHYRGTPADRRLKHEGLLLGPAVSGPLLPEICSVKDVETIRNFLPKDFSFASPPPKEHFLKDAAMGVAILAPVALYLYLPVEYILTCTAFNATYVLAVGVVDGALVYLDSSHLWQFAVHFGCFLFCLVCGWRGRDADSLFMSIVKSVPSLSPIFLHFAISVFFALSAWGMLSFVPFLGAFFRNIVVHCFLPLQSAYSMLRALCIGSFANRVSKRTFIAVSTVRCFAVTHPNAIAMLITLILCLRPQEWIHHLVYEEEGFCPEQTAEEIEENESFMDTLRGLVASARSQKSVHQPEVID